MSNVFVSCAFMSPSITNSKEPKPQQHHSNTAMYTSLKRCFWHTHIKPSTKRMVLDPGDLVWCSSRHLTSSFGELSIYRVDFWPCCIGAGGVKKHASWMMSVCIIDETINDGSILSQSLKEGDEKLGNSNFLHSFFFFLSFFLLELSGKILSRSTCCKSIYQLCCWFLLRPPQ